MVAGPDSLTLRCYGVGFGDCFLLSFHYGGRTGDRHVLIDFGTTQKPPQAKGDLMMAIARDIAKVVEGKLHVVVATHRHTDHISGFATGTKGKGTGAVIASLEPDLVIQPWTELPEAPRDFTGPPRSLTAAADSAFRLSLDRMRDVAAQGLREAQHLRSRALRELRQEIDFIADDGLTNRSAVQNLARMGRRGAAAYVHYGARISALRRLLPGVKVEVLGPPTIRQKGDVVSQRARHAEEYWHFANFWQLQAATARQLGDGGGGGGGAALFPKAAVFPSRGMPIESRWFVHRLKRMRGLQLLGIVRAMDDALNNTSVILLFKAGSKKLLFPGDAQWENWEHALGKNLDDLKDVDVYKVGHHGSLNATPKTLWNAFAKKSRAKRTAGRLTTVMSTRSESKHGDPDKGTEVPRETLVKALAAQSNLRSTQELESGGGLVLTIELDLT